jgi:hypothetical protein
MVLHQVDHIIGRQHNGPDDEGNLCLCCSRCNLKKGPNIASLDPLTDAVVLLFHPRRHAWPDHFSLAPDGALHGLTPEGRATVALLAMNDPERVQMRSLLIEGGWRPWPS